MVQTGLQRTVLSILQLTTYDYCSKLAKNPEVIMYLTYFHPVAVAVGA